MQDHPELPEIGELRPWPWSLLKKALLSICRTDHHEVQRRYARQKFAPGAFTAADIERLHEQQKGCCFYCGDCILKAFEVDHYIPLSRGGTNEPSNIVLACRPCNRAKGNKLPDLFVSNRQAGLLPSQEKEFSMTTEYLQYTCKTCGNTSYAQAANVQTQEGKRLLRCASRGHLHAYDADETESLQLEANREIRAKMGLWVPVARWGACHLHLVNAWKTRNRRGE